MQRNLIEAMHPRLGDASKLECRICWYVYDPAIGDEVWQIPSGTPFSMLPDEWRCPQCDADKITFLAIDDTTDPCTPPSTD